MLNKKTQRKGNGSITLIAQEVHFRGILDGKGMVRVDGSFEGEINVDGDVIIGEGAKVSASVQATNLTVAGTLKGTARINGLLQISAKGYVDGKVEAARMAVEEGGMLLGQCNEYPSPQELPPASGKPLPPEINKIPADETMHQA